MPDDLMEALKVPVVARICGLIWSPNSYIITENEFRRDFKVEVLSRRHGGWEVIGDVSDESRTS